MPDRFTRLSQDRSHCSALRSLASGLSRTAKGLKVKPILDDGWYWIRQDGKDHGDYVYIVQNMVLLAGRMARMPAMQLRTGYEVRRVPAVPDGPQVFPAPPAPGER